MEVFGSKIKQKISNKYCCEICDYYTNRKSNIDTHFMSVKHLWKTNKNIQQELSNVFSCKKCNKIYQTHGGLWKHLQKCKSCDNNDNDNDNKNLTNLVIELVKQNSEFKEMLFEQNKTNNELTKQVIELAKEKTITTNNTNTNTNCNNTNNKFNLNLFLNETCKDAMNMSDFLNQLQLTTKDLELTGQDGFAVGIGHSFVQGIKALEAHKRPLHCSDLKRETFYIKEDNIWEKEDEKRGKLTNAIQKIAHKNILNIPAWKAEHPHCRDQHHKDNDKFLQIMIESMTGKDDPNIMQEYDKIIRNVAKEVFINKN